MKVLERIVVIVFTTLFWFVADFQIAPSEIYTGLDEKDTVHFTEDWKTVLEKYAQNPEREYWEELPDANFPLTLIDWQIITKPSSGEKYFNKHIIGTIKNNSKKEFSEVKVQFILYNEKGGQIAIVSKGHYKFKPGDVWKFDIPVTDDVEKAKLKGLYILTKELKEHKE